MHENLTKLLGVSIFLFSIFFSVGSFAEGEICSVCDVSNEETEQELMKRCSNCRKVSFRNSGDFTTVAQLGNFTQELSKGENINSIVDIRKRVHLKITCTDCHKSDPNTNYVMYEGDIPLTRKLTSERWERVPRKVNGYEFVPFYVYGNKNLNRLDHYLYFQERYTTQKQNTKPKLAFTKVFVENKANFITSHRFNDESWSASYTKGNNKGDLRSIHSDELTGNKAIKFEIRCNGCLEPVIFSEYIRAGAVHRFRVTGSAVLGDRRVERLDRYGKVIPINKLDSKGNINSNEKLHKVRVAADNKGVFSMRYRIAGQQWSGTLNTRTTKAIHFKIPESQIRDFHGRSVAELEIEVVGLNKKFFRNLVYVDEKDRNGINVINFTTRGSAFDPGVNLLYGGSPKAGGRSLPLPVQLDNVIEDWDGKFRSLTIFMENQGGFTTRGYIVGGQSSTRSYRGLGIGKDKKIVYVPEYKIRKKGHGANKKEYVEIELHCSGCRRPFFKKLVEIKPNRNNEIKIYAKGPSYRAYGEIKYGDYRDPNDVDVTVCPSNRAWYAFTYKIGGSKSSRTYLRHQGGHCDSLIAKAANIKTFNGMKIAELDFDAKATNNVPFKKYVYIGLGKIHATAHGTIGRSSVSLRYGDDKIEIPLPRQPGEEALSTESLELVETHGSKHEESEVIKCKLKVKTPVMSWKDQFDVTRSFRLSDSEEDQTSSDFSSVDVCMSLERSADSPKKSKVSLNKIKVGYAHRIEGKFPQCIVADSTNSIEKLNRFLILSATKENESKFEWRHYMDVKKSGGCKAVKVVSNDSSEMNGIICKGSRIVSSNIKDQEHLYAHFGTTVTRSGVVGCKFALPNISGDRLSRDHSAFRKLENENESAFILCLKDDINDEDDN